ncbi:ubiquitin-conjugating enzyme E2 R [Nematocida sp. AWRm77]|nr:ubiquitin-conjugating enzyme E2 R [Nematocida sp. AWRm77]
MRIESSMKKKPIPIKRLQTEYDQLLKDPDCKWFNINLDSGLGLEMGRAGGFLCKWEIEICGFPGTIYEGYVLTAEMHFPPDYPLSPPQVFFTTKMYHPNIYEDGKVCISILHTAQTDPHTDELDTEQWTPVLSVRTILLSIVVLLNEPNINSPANVDASIQYKKNKEEYTEYVKKLLEKNAKKASVSESSS